MARTPVLLSSFIEIVNLELYSYHTRITKNKHPISLNIVKVEIFTIIIQLRNTLYNHNTFETHSKQKVVRFHDYSPTSIHIMYNIIAVLGAGQFGHVITLQQF